MRMYLIVVLIYELIRIITIAYLSLSYVDVIQVKNDTHCKRNIRAVYQFEFHVILI